MPALRMLFPGDSEMARRMREHDWQHSPLGPPQQWPQSLKTAVAICLNSRFPIVLWWGPELRLLYNDAWRPVLGRTKHPAALGSAGRQVWPEIWHIIGPMLEGVLAEGKATWSDDELLPLDRNGYLEEAYFTYSYSPIPDERGGIGGVFAAVSETTLRVLDQRRLRVLRELAAQTALSKSVGQACQMAMRTIGANPADVPFALLYLVAPGRAWQLTAHAPASVADSAQAWPVERVIESAKSELLSDLESRFGRLPSVWPTAPRQAMVLPLKSASQDRVAGVLVLGVNPGRELDEEQRGFLEMVGQHVATSLANASAYEEERRRAEALAELDRAKTTFFSNVSHEFRTPLTLMLGPMDDLLSRGADITPGQRQALALMQRNGQRLLKLVNSLLDFARIEAGRFQASYEPTDLAAYTADLASNFRSACERAGLSLEVDCPALPEPVYVDRDMWEKIVLNLLSNAFKFTLEGAISVSLRASADQARLTVRDTGSGIPAAELAHIFERFHRVEGSRGRTHEGTGIGLALVHELAKLHGGSVGVDSREGQGSAFRVTVPLGRAHLPAARIQAGRSLVSSATHAAAFVEEALRWLPHEASAGEAAELDIGQEAPAQAAARILLADDNADMRDYVSRLLEGHYQVEAVADGEAALQAARRSAPDLVIADIMMPRLDGFALVRALRGAEATRLVPVILLSARAGEEAKVEGLERGADDYLVKPFSARELIARVGAHLALADQRRDATRILAGISDGLVSFDRDWRYTFVNERAAQMLGKDRAALLGRRLWEVFAELEQTPLAERLRHAMHSREPVRLEHFSVARELWYEVRAYPAQGGLAVFFMDVTARKRADDALREADRRKDEFLAVLAHELRNPLAPIRSAVELLGLRQRPSEELQAAREVIERQVGNMARLIEDLMDVSRITRGKLELRRQRLDLGEAVRSAVETSRPLIDAQAQELSVTLPARPLCVEADATRIAQVISNLLNNASRYSPRGGRIALAAAHEAGDAVIRVRDQGAGIPPDMLERIWDLFVQAERAPELSNTGLGIGLTIVRSLVEMHGGKVEAHSAGKGQGAEFVVRLPLAPWPPQDAAAAAKDEARGAALAGRRILIADDNADAASSLGMLLQALGNEVRIAADGAQAVAAAAEYRPELALLDIGMPNLNGYEAAQRIRSAPWGGGITLVAVTGWGQEHDRQRSKAAGFDHHLVKPIELAALEQLLCYRPG